MDSKEIKLCCGRRRCPVLKEIENRYYLYEDFGGGVTFNLLLVGDNK